MTWLQQNRGLPSKRVLKPSDCLVSCLASKLVINSTLLMAWEAVTIPADRTPLGRRQSFHLLIGAMHKHGRRSRENQRVERAKAFDKEGESRGGVRAARVGETGRRLRVLLKGAAYSEGNGWTRFRSREKTAVATGSRTNLRDHTKTLPFPSTTRFYNRQGRRAGS
jgi:hypothetical protein